MTLDDLERQLLQRSPIPRYVQARALDRIAAVMEKQYAAQQPKRELFVSMARRDFWTDPETGEVVPTVQFLPRNG